MMGPRNQELHDALEALIMRLVIGEVQHINHKLDRIINTMATKDELDAAIAGLDADLDAQAKAIDDAVQAIIDKIAQSGTPIDLQTEIDALKAVQGKLDAVKDGLPSTPTPPSP